MDDPPPRPGHPAPSRPSSVQPPSSPGRAPGPAQLPPGRRGTATETLIQVMDSPFPGRHAATRMLTPTTETPTRGHTLRPKPRPLLSMSWRWKVFLTLPLFKQEHYFTWAGFALGAPAPVPHGRAEKYYSSILGIRLYVLRGLLINATSILSDCKRAVDGQRAASIPARISWKGGYGRISRAHFCRRPLADGRPAANPAD